MTSNAAAFVAICTRACRSSKCGCPRCARGYWRNRRRRRVCEHDPTGAGTPVAKPWLQAFNAAGSVIGTVYYPAYGTAGFGQWQTLRIDDPTGSIKSVRFSSQHFNNSPAVYGVFDKLTFNTDPYWIAIPIKPIKLPIERPILLQPVPLP